MIVAQVEAQLRAVLDDVESAYARGAPPTEIMPMWYDLSDVVVVGEGDTCASRGFPAVLAQALSGRLGGLGWAGSSFTDITAARALF